MKNKNVNAQAYASALYEVAKSKRKESQVLYDIREIDKSIKKEISELFNYPVITKEEKKEILESLTSVDLSHELINLLKLLVDFNDMHLFVEIFEEYVQMYKEDNNIVIVDLTFAKEPTKDNYNKTISMLEERINSFVVVKKKIDPTIISGVIINYNGKEIDNSVKTHLSNLLKTI